MTKHTPRPKTKPRPARVTTRLGRLPRVGINAWGKPLVACPQCGAPAVVDTTQEISCRACGYATPGLGGCG